jgi:NAD(P)-dependent dehydrogenase (short-subunit alcohol dehydrogenase family)
MELDEQIVVVTVANGAVGSVLVDHLKTRAAHVVGCLHGAGVDWRPAEDRLSYITCNLTDRVAVNFLVAEILRHLDGCHTWINVAGGFSMDGLVEEVPAEAWPRLLDLNFITCLNACQAILPVFKEHGFGCVINFGSVAGDLGMAKAGPYAMSKAAVMNLTFTLAQEGAPEVTANLIIPNIVDTPANRKAMPQADFSSWTHPLTIADKIVDILSEADHPPNGERFIF